MCMLLWLAGESIECKLPSITSASCDIRNQNSVFIENFWCSKFPVQSFVPSSFLSEAALLQNCPLTKHLSSGGNAAVTPRSRAPARPQHCSLRGLGSSVETLPLSHHSPLAGITVTQWVGISTLSVQLFFAFYNIIFFLILGSQWYFICSCCRFMCCERGFFSSMLRYFCLF